jgi:hypothetical protein
MAVLATSWAVPAATVGGGGYSVVGTDTPLTSRSAPVLRLLSVQVRQFTELSCISLVVARI